MARMTVGLTFVSPGLAHQESFGDLLGGLSMGGGPPPLVGPDGEATAGEPLSPGKLRPGHEDGIVCMQDHGPDFNIKSVFPGMGIPIIKIRRSYDRLIFTMGIP